MKKFWVSPSNMFLRIMGDYSTTLDQANKNYFKLMLEQRCYLRRIWPCSTTLFTRPTYHFIKLSGQRTQTSATNWRILRVLTAMVEIVTEGSMAGFFLLSPLRLNIDVLHEMVRSCVRCNNLRNPYWGAANIGMRRYLNAEYQDSQNIPTGWLKYSKIFWKNS